MRQNEPECTVPIKSDVKVLLILDQQKLSCQQLKDITQCLKYKYISVYTPFVAPITMFFDVSVATKSCIFCS